METNKNLDRTDEIFYNAMDYVKEREEAAFLKLCDKHILFDDYDNQFAVDCMRQKTVDFVKMIETDMYAEGIITTADYEMYGDEVYKSVTTAVCILIEEYAFPDSDLDEDFPDKI